MSYKIVVYALMNHINKDCEIKCSTFSLFDSIFSGHERPAATDARSAPDPWLLDTESLLSELARVRGLALNIPAARNDILGPIASRKLCCTGIMKGQTSKNWRAMLVSVLWTRLTLENWRAKLISLVLATTVWYLIKKNITTTESPSERPSPTPVTEPR